MKKRALFLYLLFLSVPTSVYAQCSCGGTPLLGSLDLPATSAGQWQFALTYDFNNIKDFYSGTRKLDNPLKRKTHSGLYEASYGLTTRLSISTLISFVQQNRKATNSISTRGFGDVAVLAKFNIIPLDLQNQRSLAIGIGPKIPVGDSKTRNDQGILLPETLQPGTGSWDLLLWGYLFQGFQPRTSANIFVTTSYKISGENWRNFRYGNELSLTTGSSYTTSTPFDFSLLLRYRTIDEFELNGETEPNTGGTWLNIIPGINFKISNAIALRLSGEIPLYRNLKGTQLTTTYTTSVSLFYTIAKQPKFQVF